MINSIPKIESNSVNTFGQVTNKKLPSDYWLARNENKKEPEYQSLAAKIKIMTPEEARKTNNLKIIGLSVAGVTILTAAGIFFVLKGGPKGLSKNFKKLQAYFQRKLQDIKLNNTEKESSFTSRAYMYMVKILDTAVKRSEAINNFTSFKDVLFKKLMGLNKFTGKVHDSVTRMFEKIGRQTVKNSYAHTAGKVQETKLLTDAAASTIMRSNIYDVIEINGLSQTKSQWLAYIDKLNKELNTSYNSYFSNDALTGRYHTYKVAAEELKSAFAKMKVFLSKDVFQKFLADSKINRVKTLMSNNVHSYRRELSYSMQDMAKEADDMIMDMTGIINFKDVNKISLLRNIRKDIRKYVKNPQNEDLRHQILKEMTLLRKNISDALANKAIDEKTGELLLDNITKLKGSFGGFEQGKTEKILNIYKHILPEKEYKTLEKAYKAQIKSLDKAITTETEDFISKLRDLSLGSAPTDILSLLGGLGVLSYHLGKSEDNEQRTSIALKYGIPALSLIGVSLYCNAKLYAGTKGLLIGTLASAILNRIGVAADDMLKHRRQQKKETTAEEENPPKKV